MHRQSVDRRQESRPHDVSFQQKQESESAQNKSKGHGVAQRNNEPLLRDARGDIKYGSEDEEMLDLQRPLPDPTETTMYAGSLPLTENLARKDLQQDTIPAKRRRLDASRVETNSAHDTMEPHTPSRPRFRHHVPATTLPHGTNSTPMFNSPRPFHAVLSSAASSHPQVDPSVPASAMPSASRPPRFIVPNSTASPSPAPHINSDAQAQTQQTQQPPPPATILPDIFSPHKRKHERFVPGGWAAQVRNWVLDVSVASPSGTGSRQVLLPDAFLFNDPNSKTRSRSKSKSRGEVEMVVRSIGMASGAGGGDGIVGMLKGEIHGKDKDIGVVLVGEGGQRRDVGIERRNVIARECEGLREGAKVVLGLPAWEVDVDVRGSSEQGDKMERWTVCPVWRMK